MYILEYRSSVKISHHVMVLQENHRCQKLAFDPVSATVQFCGIQFSSVESLSRFRVFSTPCIAACQASLSITNSRSLLKLKSIKSVMPSNQLILCWPLSSHLQSYPAPGSFPMSHFFASGGQGIGVYNFSFSLWMNIQDWIPFGLTGWLSLYFKGLSRVFANTKVQKHQFFGTHFSLLSNSHIHKWILEKPQLWLDRLLLAK